MRSIGLAALLALVAGTQAEAQVQAVPRAGVTFTNAVTVRAQVVSIDAATRTIVFTTNEGKLMNLAVSDSVTNLAALPDGANASISYNEVVTLLNLRQKGPGSKEARLEGAKPDAAERAEGRITLTVVAVDLPNDRLSVIDGRGGEVRTLAATSVAQKDSIHKIKVGDVIVGLTTPLTVTAIAPVK